MVHMLNYMYAVINCSEYKRFGPIGIKGEEVFTVPYEDVSAAVSKIKVVFKPDFTVVEPTEGNWCRHDEVVMRLMREYTVVPVKFGSILKFDRDLEEMLQRCLLELRAELKLFKGRFEVDVKVLAEDEDVKHMASKESRCIDVFKRGLIQAEVLKKYTLLGEAVERQLSMLRYGKDPELSTMKAYYADRVYNTLSRLAVRARADSPSSDDIVLNAHFLIEKSSLGAFQLKMSELKERYRSFRFLLSGPQPPYSFTKISW